MKTRKQHRDQVGGAIALPNLYTNLYSSDMAPLLPSNTVSVSDANARGVSGLLKDAESGSDVVVARHGRPVAAIVGIRRLEEIADLEADLRSAALVLARAATDNGVRLDLDEVINAFGFSRAELEAELDAELAGEPRAPR